MKPSVKKLIHDKARQNKETLRLALATELRNLITEMNEVPPTEETMIREISWARNHPENPFDELWSFGSLVEYPIPSEAMPVVMSSYKKALAEKDELTVREAQWIARLHKIVDPPDLVLDWAYEYAMSEWLSEITNKPFDTTELDLKMVSNPQYAKDLRRTAHREIAIWSIATEYGADPMELKKLNLSIEETEKIAKSGKYQKEGTR